MARAEAIAARRKNVVKLREEVAVLRRRAIILRGDASHMNDALSLEIEWQKALLSVLEEVEEDELS